MPKHLVFCVSGFSGTGKDEIAKRLVSDHESVHIGLVDEAKRHMGALYGFTRDQLFGPSELRNDGDPRFPKKCFLDLDAQRYGVFGKDPGFCGIIGDLKETTYYKCVGRHGSLMDGVPYRPLRLGDAEHFIADTDPRFFLSPRECLQKHCELMQDLYEFTWVKSAMDTARQMSILKDEVDLCMRRYTYDRMGGISECHQAPFLKDMEFVLSCFSDFRHRHEMEYARSRTDHRQQSILVRVKRPGIEDPPYDHRSETEQATIADSEFDFVINNDGSMSDLWEKVDDMVRKVKGRKS